MKNSYIIIKKLINIIMILIVTAPILSYVYAYDKITNYDMGIEYCGYIDNAGTNEWEKNDELLGTEGKGIGLNGLKIKLINAPINTGIEYMVLKDENNTKVWTDWIEEGKLAGFEENGKSIYAIRIRLKNLDNYSVEYRVHRRYQGWEDCYLADGDIAGKQNIDSRIEGIKIRIVPKIIKAPQVIYRGYIDNFGFQKSYSKDDMLTGTEGKGIGLNGIKLELLYGNKNSNIEYKVLKDTENNKKIWTEWVSSGELAGFEENGKSIYAIRIRLKNMENFSIAYKIHRRYQGWEKNYVYDGETIGLEYSDSRIEGIKIKIIPKINKAFGVAYSGFINNKGYQERVGSEGLIGTQNQGIGLNGLKIELRHSPDGAGIEYQGYVQGIGWQEVKKEGEFVGSEQNGISLYGIRIRLTNSKDYSIQYRVHSQYVGWKDTWVSDGELAGVENSSSRIEGIQIRIVPKIHHRIICLETPTNENIVGNKLKIKGWEISEDKERIVRLYIDNIFIKTLNKANRQDILDKYIIEKASILQNFGGIECNKVPGFEDEIDISKLKEGDHLLTIKIYSQKGSYIAEMKKRISIYGNHIYSGIDISEYNGNINWKNVKQDNIDFAIIRVGYRGYESGKIVFDSKFKENAISASLNNIKVGAYFVTQAINYQEGVEEANEVLKKIKEYQINITYPIVVDIEWAGGDEGHNGRADYISIAGRTQAASGFGNTIKNAGYTPMIYANKYWLISQLDMSKLNNFDVWLAHYVVGAPEKRSDYTGKYLMWQYTSKGRINGISGDVDLNILYK